MKGFWGKMASTGNCGRPRQDITDADCAEFDEINAFSDSLEIEIFTDKNCIIEYHLTALEKGCGHCKVLTMCT